VVHIARYVISPGVLKIAENGKKAISSLKIRPWTTIPLKVGIIATFRGLLSD
jgi:hypothetical protein